VSRIDELIDREHVTRYGGRVRARSRVFDAATCASLTQAIDAAAEAFGTAAF
jgi:hypothetical protein